MGLWKIALALLIGAALTERGRQTLRNLAKEVIKTGQSATDKAAATLNDLKVETKAFIEEAKEAKAKDPDNGSKKV